MKNLFVFTPLVFCVGAPRAAIAFAEVHAASSAPSRKAVVVGGGPAGLSTAIVLVRYHGYTVKVLEAASEEDVACYDRNKAYLYNVNMRGQVILKRAMPAVQQGLEERGVGIVEFERLTVPGDPNKVFTNVPFSRPMSDAEKKRMGTLYWIPRHEFVKLLLEEVEKEPSIEVCFGVDCEEVIPSSVSGLEVKCIRVSDSTKLSFDANLVVGADGLHSKVRASLAQSPSLFSGWRHASPRRFHVKKWKTPSTGLRIKTLQVESNFTIPVGDGTSVPFNSTANYAIQSNNTGWTDQITLTLLPMRDSSAIRPSAICTLPNHDVWKITSGDEMREWFAKAFPRFSFASEGDDKLVADEEWDRFAQSDGSRFPPCQYSPGLVATNGESSGIALLGDAIHAFPPDLGQGVNAALGDVAVLDDCLSQYESLDDALEEYENTRGPEVSRLAIMNSVRYCRYTY